MSACPSEPTPTPVPNLTTMGRQLLEQGAYADAARALGRQLRLAPSDRHARYLLGAAWIGLGQRRLAREHFHRVASGEQDQLATLARAWLRRLAGLPEEVPPVGSDAP
jgi:Flp pilus assembly protein TadD